MASINLHSSHNTAANPSAPMSKCTMAALTVGTISGSILAGISLLGLFGPIGSTGFMVSLSAGGVIIFFSGIGIVRNFKSDPQNQKSEVPNEQRCLEITDNECLTHLSASESYEVNMDANSILIRSGPKLLGIITNNQEQTRKINLLLEKNPTIISSILVEENTKKLLGLLAREVGKELPQNVLAGFCYMDRENNQFFAQGFGNAKLRVRVESSAIAVSKNEEPGSGAASESDEPSSETASENGEPSIENFVLIELVLCLEPCEQIRLLENKYPELINYKLGTLKQKETLQLTCDSETLFKTLFESSKFPLSEHYMIDLKTFSGESNILLS